MSNKVKFPAFLLFVLALALFAVTLITQAVKADPDVQINEIRIDQSSTDNDEYFELSGGVAESLDGLTYLVIGDSSAGSGVIEAVVDLNGWAVGGSGLFVAAESTFTLGVADLTTNLNFENSDNVTHMLVRDFSGSDGDDLDTDDDGTLDSTPWSEVADCVALVESTTSGELTYCDTAVGPDGSFVPGHVFLCTDGWHIGSFDPMSDDTPGTANNCDSTPPTATPPPPPTATPPPPAESDVVINEIHADPASGLEGDANGDGVRDATQDEFVEIVNNSGAELDVSNWTISDEFGLRHTFPAGTIIPDQCSVVVFGGQTPTGTFGGSIVQVASTGALGLNNSGDTVTLNDGAADVVAYTYGSEGGDNQSLTRDPDISGAAPLIKHTDAAGAAGALFSPGTLVDGSTFSGCASPVPFVTIMEIQGDGGSSPLEGQVVTTEGVITANFPGSSGLNGFFMQDTTGDGNPATSDGIFVFAPGSSVTVGDLVHVTGEVQEYFGFTELGSVSDITSFGPGPSIAPTVVTMPVASVDDWEMVEGMLIKIDQELSVSDNYNQARYGEVLLSVNGRLQSPTNVAEPGAPANALQDANNLRSIQLDDGSSVQNPLPLPPYVGPDNTLRAGDTIPELVGVVGYAFSTYEIHPPVPADVSFTRANDRPEMPGDLGGSLRVASFNVLNYFTTIDNGSPICGPNMDQDCRGADSPEEFTRQRDKIISAIVNMDADIIGLMEIENNASASLQDLVNGLNDVVGAGTYDFIDAGFVGSDAIKVGLIYQTASATPVGDFAILDSSVDPMFNDDKNRAVLAQTFAENATGEMLTIAVNHLKSKGSDCDDLGDPDTGDGQGNCNITRTNAAIAEANWLASDPTNSGDRDFLIIGDLNAYNMEDPVEALVDSGFTDLGTAFQGIEAYSYVFFGQAGALDHSMSSPNLTAQVTGAEIWHINADEPNGLSYESFNQPDLYNPDQYRSSDHDPVIVELNLTEHVTNADGCYMVILEGSPFTGAGTIVETSPYYSFFNAISWANQEGLPNDACFEIHGTNEPDKIRGGHSNDTILGYDEHDALIGGSGDDTFVGGPGADMFFGQLGFDTVLDFESGVDECHSIEAGCE